MENRRSSYDYDELLACGRGELFGAGNAQLPLPPMLMFDRISEIAEVGGAHSKGLVRAVLDLKPDLWYFPCHFKGDRHLTAEMLYDEAANAKVPVSLATVYNTLHQFTDVGLLRQVAVDGSKTYFDTNVSQHHHFFVEGENALVDIPNADVIVDKMPAAPEGYEVARVDVIVRVKRKA